MEKKFVSARGFNLIFCVTFLNYKLFCDCFVNRN